MNKIRVLLADDHALVRQGIRLLVDTQADMEVIGEAADGDEAFRLGQELRPDVVLMDLSMPRMTGAVATERLKRACPDVRILALTRHSDIPYLRQLVQAGADGYLLKQAAAEELIFAIRRVMAGGTYVDPTMARRAVEQREARPTRGDVKGRTLSDREEQVLRETAWGYSNKEIAAHLDISVKTVEGYKTSVMQKLGFQSRSDVVRYALRRGWLREG
jgi:DNA-binding NarL/FixJ family response regulator